MPLSMPRKPAPAGGLLGHPFATKHIALSPAALRRCADLDAKLSGYASLLQALNPTADLDVVVLVERGKLSLEVASDAAPVRFPARPSLRQSLRERATIPSCKTLSDTIANRALTPWRLRQEHAAVTKLPMLPFRSGSHHLAADADGIAVTFPPTDCARVLAALCAWLNAAPPLPVTAQALIAYLQLCKLHAFHDGNGRIARLLLTAVLSARLLGGQDLYLPLAAVIFANAEFVSAEYRRAADAGSLENFVLYGAALLDKVLCAAGELTARDAPARFGGGGRK